MQDPTDCGASSRISRILVSLSLAPLVTIAGDRRGIPCVTTAKP